MARWQLVEEEEEEEEPGFTDKVRDSTLRAGARIPTKLATRAAGTPGDVLSMIQSGVSKPLEKLTGKEFTPYEETPWGKRHPTTETIREKLPEGYKEYIEPQNKIESFIDDVVEDTAMLMTPGGMTTRSGKVISGTQKLVRNLAKSIGANTAGEGVEAATGSSTAKNWTKFGLLFMTSLWDKPTAKTQVSNMYKNAELAIPEGATMNAKTLHKDMEKIQHNLLQGRPKGHLSSDEKQVFSSAEKVMELIKNGKISVKAAWAQLKTINKDIEKLVGETPWHQFKRKKDLRKLMVDVNKGLNKSLKDYGKTNKEFGANFGPAQEAYAADKQAAKLGKWVANAVKSTPATAGLMKLFGATGVLGKAVGASAVGTAAYQSWKLGYKIAKSPTLRKIYGNALKAATKENAAEFNKSIELLDKELQKDMSGQTWQLVD